MNKVSKKQIDSFFESRRFAIAGVSRNPKKFGRQVFTDLRKKGFDIVPINPAMSELDGETCYKSVDEIPGDIDSLLILTPKTQTDLILRQAIRKGIKNIWVQQMSDTDDTLRIAEEYEKEIISGKCVYMFAEPVQSVHKFHRTLMKIFGRLPK